MKKSPRIFYQDLYNQEVCLKYFSNSIFASDVSLQLRNERTFYISSENEDKGRLYFKIFSFKTYNMDKKITFKDLLYLNIKRELLIK